MATAKNALEKITGWVTTDDDLSMDAQGNIVVGGEVTIAVEVDDQRVLLSHTAADAGGDDARVEELRSKLPGRASTIDGEVTSDGSAITVALKNPIYLDGLNHQTLATALHDLVGASDAMGLGDPPAEMTEPAAEAAAPAPEPAADPTPAPPPEEPKPAPATAAPWTATHTVPAGGLSAWADPDPTAQPSATLEARVELAVDERRGDWAKVTGANGWTGWVDARRLVEIGATAPAPAAAAAPAPPRAAGGKPTWMAASINPLVLAGGVFVAISAFLPWLDDGTSSFNGLDLSAKLLFDYKEAGSPDLAWVVIGIGVLIAAVAVTGKAKGGAAILGILAIAVAALFSFQINQFVSDLGGSFSDITDVLGFAPAVALGGGILALIGARR